MGENRGEKEVGKKKKFRCYVTKTKRKGSMVRFIKKIWQKRRKSYIEWL